MNTKVNLYSSKKGEIKRFLKQYEGKEEVQEQNLKWEREYLNPIEMTDIIGVFIENHDEYHINMWVSFDAGVLINVTENNADQIIRYLFERYPY